MYRRYVAIGDSTTEGLEDPDGLGGYRGWANRFAEHLARAWGPIEYANLAVSGSMARQVRTDQLERAVEMRPDVSTVVAGVNDLLRPRFDLDTVAGDVQAMIEALRGAGSTVLTFTMPDLARVMPLARLVRTRLEALNERLRETAHVTGALLVDLEANPIAGDPRLWHEDRLHANALGHERIAAGLAHRLGIDGYHHWSAPLPELPQANVLARAKAEARWARRYLLPWVAQRARGHSDAFGRAPKRPNLQRFP